MKIFKFSELFKKWPRQTVDNTDPLNPIIIDSALFTIIILGQRTVKHQPTEILGVVPSVKDSAVNTWWNGLSALEQAGCRQVSRADFDILSDNYIQICMPPNPAKTHFQLMQEYLEVNIT